jgi:hypothetical protein
LSPDGGTLQIDASGVTRARIDTRTFAVDAAVPHASPASVRSVSLTRRGSRGGLDVPWTLIALFAAALGALSARAGIVRSRRQPTDDRDLDAARIIHVDAEHR